MFSDGQIHAVYIGNGNKTKALEDFSMATLKSPSNPDGFYQLGLYYFNQDDFKKIPVDFSGIVFCSIQYLKIDKNIKKQLLMDTNFNAMIIDECHLGSSNDRTKKDILEKTALCGFRVF